MSNLSDIRDRQPMQITSRISIHDLAEIRGAILSVIDEGRLVSGKREPWSFYPDLAVEALRRAVRRPDDPDSWMIPDTDGECGRDECFFCGKSEEQEPPFDTFEHDPQCAGLLTRAALASDWHMDESGDCNLQRLDFVDEVQSLLVKKIVQG